MKAKLFNSWKCAAVLGVLSAGISIALAENPAGENERAFAGRIHVALTRDNQTEELLYTTGTHFLRVESAATNGPNPVDIWNRSSGELTLVFPHNRSFTRVKTAAHLGAASALAGRGATPATATAHDWPETPRMPQMPPGTMPGPAMIPRPPMTTEKPEFRATNEKTNILGYACEHFQILQRGKTMDIWATHQLGAFQPYRRSQPPSAGANTIEEQWADSLKARRLFPLVAILKLENGLERLRFEVTSVAPQTIADDDATLFQPPTDYHEALPLPF